MCVHKTEDGKCRKFSDKTVVSYCVEGPCGYDTPSNYDRIKVMSVDEMAEFLEAETYDSCEHTASWYTEWLNSPAEGGAE